MAQLDAFLETGDQVASIAGAVIAIIALGIAVRAGPTGSRRGGPRVALLAVGIIVLAAAAAALAVRAAAWILPVAAVATALLIRQARRARLRPDAQLTAMLTAQRADSARHRYRFFGRHVPALTDLYVRPRAQPGGPGGRESVRTVYASQAFDAHRHLVLLGDAGAGKSTFLATVAADLARQALARRSAREPAVLVQAADLTGRGLPEALAHAVRRDLNVDMPAEVFAGPPVPGGTWRVLVDGLDEVVDAEERSAVLWRMRDLLTATGPHRFLITCRPLAESELGGLRRPEVGEYDLRPFSRAGLAEFARRWFTARYPDDQRRADRAAGRFLARVAGARLGPVARIPLLATIAALVYEQEDERALPSSRAALYERFVAHLLDGRRSLTRLRAAVEPELLARGAPGRELAAWLWADIYVRVGALLDACGAGWLADPDRPVAEVAAGWMRAHAPHDLTRIAPDGDRVLRELLLATGVFTLLRERVVFAHQSFAEFFAARAGDAAFDPGRWRARAADPAGRSLAAFAAARRPESDRLVASLLGPGAEPDLLAVAGDLLADGVPVSPETRVHILDRLLVQVTAESALAPDALRILGELSVEADVLNRMTALAGHPRRPAWTRALVADRIADVDQVIGVRLLRAVAVDADQVVRAWVADALEERGARADPLYRVPLDEGGTAESRPLGILARQALGRRLTDARASEAERLDAAAQLARGGDLTPLREMVDAVDVDRLDRVRMATALADAGDPETLRHLAAGQVTGRWPAATTGDWLRASFAAGIELHRRGDPAAVPALRAIVELAPGAPMAYGAAARIAETGDAGPLAGLARDSAQPQVRLAAVRRLARLDAIDALAEVLDETTAPAIAAEAVAAVAAVRPEFATARARDLLARHRLPAEQRIRLYSLLAGLGDRDAADHLHRAAAWRSGSLNAVLAAVALAAARDPRGRAVLLRVAGQSWRRDRTRMRAAVGLARAAPGDGLPTLMRLAAPGSPRGLRLRAAVELARSRGDEVPLADFVLDPAIPAGDRRTALNLLADLVLAEKQPGSDEFWYERLDPTATPRRRVRLSPRHRAMLAAVATDPAAPDDLRTAAARLLPDERAKEVYREAGRNGTAAAIRKLAALDRVSATEALNHAVRDRRRSRVRRWVLVLQFTDELRPPEDSALFEDLLQGSPWRYALRVVRTLAREPDRVLAGG